MKILCIKSKEDKEKFSFPRKLGFEVIELDKQEKIDKELENYIKKSYKTFFISNELASFSEDIMKKYYKSNDIKIIILPPKK